MHQKEFVLQSAFFSTDYLFTWNLEQTTLEFWTRSKQIQVCKQTRLKKESGLTTWVHCIKTVKVSIVRAQSSCQFDLRQYLRPQCLARGKEKSNASLRGALWCSLVPCGALWCIVAHCGTLLVVLCGPLWCTLKYVALCSILWHCYNTARQTCTKPKVPPTGLHQTLIHLNESDKCHWKSASLFHPANEAN